MKEAIAKNDDVPFEHCCNNNNKINNGSSIELQGYLSNLFATSPHFGTCCRSMVHVCDITCECIDNVVMLSYFLYTFYFVTC
jgi:hypothetical protein